MKTKELKTAKGNFLIMDLPAQVSEFTHSGKIKLVDDEGVRLSGINFLKDITEEQCKEIVEEYGPFGEFKGSDHPTVGGMKHRAYRSPIKALKCLVGDGFENAYVFRKP